MFTGLRLMRWPKHTLVYSLMVYTPIYIHPVQTHRMSNYLSVQLIHIVDQLVNSLENGNSCPINIYTRLME